MWQPRGRLQYSLRWAPSGKPAGEGDQPFLNLWRQHAGRTGGLGAPCLRFAIWADGPFWALLRRSRGGDSFP